MGVFIVCRSKLFRAFGLQSGKSIEVDVRSMNN